MSWKTQRAQILLTKFEKSNFRESPIKVNLTFRNTGKSPATDVRVKIATIFISKINQVPRTKDYLLKEHGIIGQDQEFEVIGDTGIIWSEPHEALLKGEARLLCTGSVTFEDGLGPGRTTKFRIVSVATKNQMNNEFTYELVKESFGNEISKI